MWKLKGIQGKARIGSLFSRKLGESESEVVHTPNFFVQTSCGVIPYGTDKLISEIVNNENFRPCYDISFSDMITSKDVLLNFRKINEEKKTRCFLNYDCIDSFYHLSCRNHLQCCYVDSLHPNSNHIVMNTSRGRMKINKNEYLEFVEIMDLDSIECPCIEVKEGFPKVSRNVHMNALKQIDEWSSFLLTSLNNRLIFLPLLLISEKNCYYNLYENFDDLILKKVSSNRHFHGHGYSFIGFNSGILESEALEIVKEKLELIRNVESQNPRMMNNVGRPDLVLKLIKMGCDIFNTDYPTNVAKMGCALIFPVQIMDLKIKMENHQNNKHKMIQCPYKINLMDRLFSKDKNPLVENCKCCVCIDYSRAYIHHLVHCQEMLANVLLTM